MGYYLLGFFYYIRAYRRVIIIYIYVAGFKSNIDLYCIYDIDVFDLYLFLNPIFIYFLIMPVGSNSM